MIKEFELFHGLVFSRLVHATDLAMTIKPLPSLSNSAYVVNESVGLYIKYSTKRLSPWQFSFNKTHLGEVLLMKRELPDVAVVLVCGEDGIATLTFSEFREVLGEQFNHMGWISVARKARQMYGVKGSAGELIYKIADKECAIRILSLVKTDSLKNA